MKGGFVASLGGRCGFAPGTPGPLRGRRSGISARRLDARANRHAARSRRPRAGSSFHHHRTRNKGPSGLEGDEMVAVWFAPVRGAAEPAR